MTETNDVPASLAKWVLLAVLAAASLACLIAGGIFYGWVVADYLHHDSPFTGLQMLGWILGLMAAGVVMAGFLLAGVLFRFLPWLHAPVASLILSIFSVLFIMATYAVFSDTGSGSDSIEVFVLQGCSIVLLLVVALPPFLHWWKAPQPRS